MSPHPSTPSVFDGIPFYPFLRTPRDGGMNNRWRIRDTDAATTQRLGLSPWGGGVVYIDRWVRLEEILTSPVFSEAVEAASSGPPKVNCAKTGRLKRRRDDRPNRQMR